MCPHACQGTQGATVRLALWSLTCVCLGIYRLHVCVETRLEVKLARQGLDDEGTSSD